MTLIVCLDDQLGMMFNHRRQSRDSVLIDDVVATVGDARLLVTPYSALLFADKPCRLVVTSDPLTAVREGDCYFLEEADPAPFATRFSTVIVYRWNKCYPADLFCTIDMRELRRTERSFFPGSSHKTITKEVWKR